MAKIKKRHPRFAKRSKIIYNPKKCYIAETVEIDITGSVNIGDYTRISSGVHIITHKHHWGHSRKRRKDIQKITVHDLEIGKDVFIGINAIIIGISKIGDGDVIGAGAVVTKDVEPYNIVAGNPAKVINIRKEDK